jgi:alkylhydroperoxidase family enzyme
MPRVAPLPVPGNSYYRVLGHRPGLAQKWRELDDEQRTGGTLGQELKEQVRRAMAPAVGCEFCRTLGGGPRSDIDARTSLAIAYAMQIVDAHQEIDDSFFGVLREDFSEGEIVELTMWICCVAAGQMFGAVMQIGEADAHDKAMFDEGNAALAAKSAGVGAQS